jgi:general secretion pathway protein E/type IV pilus assembly protein PilB
MPASPKRFCVAPQPSCRPKLGELLRDKGLVGEEQIRFALQAQEATRERIGAALTRLGLLTERELMDALAEQLGLERADLRCEQPVPEALSPFSMQRCLALRILPLRVAPDKRLLVATCEPPDARLEQAVLRAAGLRPRFVLAEESLLVEAIHAHYCFLENPVETLLRREAEALNADASQSVSPEPFVRCMLLLAIERRATDIHLRPMAKGLSLAYRVDGVLRNELFLSPRLSRVIPAIKLMAGMDIAEQRLPQDGRWSTSILEKRYDIRASTLATNHGENLVLRLLSQEKAGFELPSLGFLDEDAQRVRQAFEEPYGLVLLTGPTGAGKSTTLVAGLAALDLLGRNVLTIEDPIEYIVPLARQTEVNEAAGYDFSNAMRSFLRHDPDVILVGELRDEKTAKTALDAASTGHLVLSTLHANTALSAIPRLRGLGVDNQALADSLVCVVSQRLARMVCARCAVTYAATEQERAYLQIAPSLLRKGQGCDFCQDAGYHGRTIIYEILLLDQALSELLERGCLAAELRDAAKRSGFTPLFDVGVRKVLAGVTTARELRRVLGVARR